MKTKTLNSTYLTAKYLLSHKKSYIHNMKKVTKANNVGQRIMSLRVRFGWDIQTICEGIKNGVAVYHYKVLKTGNMPEKFN